MKIASFDIGIHNLPVVIEEFDHKKLLQIKNIPDKRRYTQNGEPTEEFKAVLKQVYENGNVIFYDKRNFQKEALKSNKVNHIVLLNIGDWIRSLTVLLDCDIILIEAQMKTNPVAQRIEAHVNSVLLEMFRDRIVSGTVEILAYQSKNKTRVLGAPKKIDGVKMKPKQRKDWAGYGMTEIFTLRNDIQNYLEFTSGNRKYDDESDCLLMIQSAKYLIFVDKALKDSTRIYTNETVETKVCEKKHESTESMRLQYDKKIKEKYGDKCQCITVLKDDGGVLQKGKNKCQLRCQNNHVFWKSVEQLETQGKNSWCFICKEGKNPLASLVSLSSSSKIDTRCPFILTRGINKGNVCGKTSTKDSEYCKAHSTSKKIQGIEIASDKNIEKIFI